MVEAATKEAEGKGGLAVPTGAAARAAAAPRTIEMAPEQINALQKISAQFAAQIPRIAVTSGRFDPEAPPPPLPSADVVGEIAGVVDGRYRVEGNDWIMEITGGKIMYVRGRPEDDPATIITLPAQPVPVPPPTEGTIDPPLPDPEVLSGRQRNNEGAAVDPGKPGRHR